MAEQIPNRHIESTTGEFAWPDARFKTAPPAEDATPLAQAAREKFCDESGVVDVEMAAKAAGATINMRALGAHIGLLQASLTPKKDGFDLWLDTRTTHIDAHETTHSVLRYRIGHELGHTFFYEREPARPRRLPASRSYREEKFCDQFAQDMLLPNDWPNEAPGMKEIQHISDLHKVPISLTAERATKRHSNLTIAAAFLRDGTLEVTRRRGELSLSKHGVKEDCGAIEQAIEHGYGRSRAFYSKEATSMSVDIEAKRVDEELIWVLIKT